MYNEHIITTEGNHIPLGKINNDVYGKIYPRQSSVTAEGGLENPPVQGVVYSQSQNQGFEVRDLALGPPFTGSLNWRIHLAFLNLNLFACNYVLIWRAYSNNV